MSKSISAFVPTFNNENTIRSVLQSIKSQTVKPEKIIVIDSGSTDSTENIVKEEGCEFYPPNYFGFDFLGLGRARNRILELINTQYLLSIDSDILIEPDHIEKALSFFNKDPLIAGVAGKQIELNRIHIPDIARALVDVKDLLEPISTQTAMYRKFLMGSNNIYKVDILKKVGEKFNNNPLRPFEDDLTSNYEDVDIGNKLTSLGYKLLWTPEILTYHLQKDTFESFINRIYRYKLFEWKIKGAFKNEQIYQERIKQIVNYSKRGFEISYKKVRHFIIYPFYQIGFHFFIKDIEEFIKAGNTQFAYKIYNSFMAVLDSFVSKKLKKLIIDFNKNILDKLNFNYDKNNIDRTIYNWFKELATLEVLEKKFPAIYDFKINEIEKNIQVKSIESSCNRIKREQELNIYGDFKVLLLNLPWKSGKRYGVRAGSRWPHTQEIYIDSPIPRYIPYPFFLSYTFSLLQQNKISSWIIDAVALGYNDDECFYEIKGYNPNLIIIETSTPSYYNDLSWAEKIKENLPDAKICFVGPHVCYEKESVLKNKFIDFAINGEYEETVVRLGKALKEKKPFDNINGLIYRKERNIIFNRKTEPVDFYNFPKLINDIMPIYNYNDRTIEELEYPSLQIQLSRGCPFKCIFCLWPQLMFNSKYQKRNVDTVIEELKYAKKIFGIKSFYVDDDTFNIDRNHIISFANSLIENEVKLPWMAMARADTIVDEYTLTILKKSGLIAFKFGIESVDEKILKEMKKELNLKKCEKTIEICKSLGIKVHLTFSIGYFNDTVYSIQKTFEWLIKQNPDSMQVSIVTPFPGTEMFEQAKNLGYNIEQDFSKYVGSHNSVITSNIEPERLERIQKKWIEKWRFFKKGAAPKYLGRIA